MLSLTKLKEQARFFCVLGYPRAKVIAHLTTEHPKATPAQIAEAWDAAVAQHRESERQLDAAVRKDDMRAKLAEHDLGVSMHGDQS